MKKTHKKLILIASTAVFFGVSLFAAETSNENAVFSDYSANSKELENSTSNSADNSNSLNSSDSAEKNVKKICGGLAENKNTKGNFIQIKTVAKNGRKLKSNGTFIISQSGIIWKTEKPFASTMVITESKMVQTSASGKKSVMDGNDNEIFKTISSFLRSIFAGNSDELQQNFLTNVEISTENEWKLELQPKDANISVVMKNFVLLGKFQENQTVLSSLEMLESSGNSVKYEFSNQTYPQELTSDEQNLFENA